MSTTGEASTQAPEGAVAITAKDVLAQPAPEKFENIELWVVTSFGKSETVMIRPDIGESGKLQQSPLDGSFLGLMFEFHAGDKKNELTGRQFFSLGAGVSYKFAYHAMPVYKNGESPAEMEMKRRERVRVQLLEQKAAKLAEGLDDDA